MRRSSWMGCMPVGGGNACRVGHVPAQIAFKAAAGGQIVGAARGLGPEPEAV